MVPGKGRKVLWQEGFVGTNYFLDALWERAWGMLLLILCYLKIVRTRIYGIKEFIELCRLFFAELSELLIFLLRK